MSAERHPLTGRLRAMPGTRLLVVGDFMVDRTVYGDAGRISPEAPAPVIHVQEVREQLGGAGNVVRNLDSLGGSVCCAAVVGEDETAELLEQQLGAVSGCRAFRVIREPGRKTTLKTRVVAVQGGRPTRQAALYGHHQLLRLDEESRHPISPESIHQVLSFAAEMMSEVRGVVISDYAKGALPKHLVEELIRLARAAGKPVFVDPKERDWHRYRGAAVLTPNSVEAEAALGLQFSAAEELADLAWERTIQDRLAEWSLEGLLVTRGAEGVSLIDRQGFHHFPTSARAVFDVTGAGDTVLAVFALAVGSGASFGEAAQLGNLAAGVVVGKSGAAVAHPFEIEKELDSRHHSAETKIRTPEEIGSIAEALRRDGKKIVFTNGCFDLLHVGHVYLLREARKLGDALVVGLNSDASVQRLKGEQRPLVGSEDRAYALAALESVDYLVLFEESDPMNLLRSIRPDVLVKGDDYAESDVIGADLLKSYGGVTRLIPIRQGVSTSRLIEKIRSAGQGAESP